MKRVSPAACRRSASGSASASARSGWPPSTRPRRCSLEEKPPRVGDERPLADVTLSTYAHLFDEAAEAERVSAEDEITRARRVVRHQGRTQFVLENASELSDWRGKVPVNRESRRPDTNRGPLHYEGKTSRDARPFAGTRGHIFPGELAVRRSCSGRTCPPVPRLTYPFCTRARHAVGEETFRSRRCD
jgi:hypothetical protein